MHETLSHSFFSKRLVVASFINKSIMYDRTVFSLLIFAIAASWFCSAGLVISGLFCQDLPDEAESIEVCSTVQVLIPPTPEDFLHYSVYEFYSPEDVANISMGDPVPHGVTSFLAIRVSRDKDSSEGIENATATVTYEGNDYECSNVIYCGNDEYSADCTNTPSGKEIACSEVADYNEGCIGQYPVWFPLKPDILPYYESPCAGLFCLCTK